MVGFLAPAAPVAARPRLSALVGPVAPAPARAPLVAGPAAPVARPAWVRTAPLTEAQLLAKYPHMIPGTLRKCPARGQQAVDIRCACGAVRTLYTGDLWHVRQCRACKAGR